MATKSATTPAIERTVLHSTGLALGSIPETESDIVAGFKASRNPALVELRIAKNQRVIDALVAQEKARLEG